MAIKLGVVMDPIETINTLKDTTFALLLEAQRRGWEIFYFEQKNLFVREGHAFGFARMLSLTDQPKNYFSFIHEKTIPLSDLNMILMRKDPPCDEAYIYTTYILELAEQHGVRVINRPQSLRDMNEKFFITQFPHCCVPTLISADLKLLREFFQEHQDIICKPLNGMGGASVFRLRMGDMNASVIFETLTQHGTQFIMTQKFIPEISAGDKRVLMIHGNPVPYALARIPASGELRGNLAAGATGKAIPLSDRDRWIANEIGSTLLQKGILFAGLDIIGDYLTEINVTSPTCVRQLDQQCNLNIASDFFNGLI